RTIAPRRSRLSEICDLKFLPPPVRFQSDLSTAQRARRDRGCRAPDAARFCRRRRPPMSENVRECPTEKKTRCLRGRPAASGRDRTASMSRPKNVLAEGLERLNAARLGVDIRSGQISAGGAATTASAAKEQDRHKR